MGYRVCARTRFRTVWWNQTQENAAPEGRPSLAQRFSAGKSGSNDSSPGGTTEFSRTHYKALPAKAREVIAERALSTSQDAEPHQKRALESLRAALDKPLPRKLQD